MGWQCFEDHNFEWRMQKRSLREWRFFKVILKWDRVKSLIWIWFQEVLSKGHINHLSPTFQEVFYDTYMFSRKRNPKVTLTSCNMHWWKMSCTAMYLMPSHLSNLWCSSVTNSSCMLYSLPYIPSFPSLFPNICTSVDRVSTASAPQRQRRAE